jgi:hypothetical protein
MARPAGIENYNGPDDDTAFAAVISRSTDHVQALGRAVRSLVYDVLPQTVEVVWPRQGSVGWGTGPKKTSEQFAYLMPFKEHVTFGFYYGSELPDPRGLLGGASKNRGRMRSLKVETLEQVEQADLRSLVQAATRHRVPPPRDTGVAR